MPIVMSEKEWARLNQWTNIRGEDSEAARRREYINYLTTTSHEMTKSWPNSLENMNKRNEELRLARIEAAEQANSKFYKKYLKRQKAEQEHLMYSARDIMFKNKDAPKLLLSAVMETVVQKERIEQIKFLNKLRREEAEEKRQNDEDITRKAKEWHELLAHKKQLRFNTNKQHQKDILEQAHEIEERNRKEHEAELNQQKNDNIEADKEMAALKRFDGYFKKAEKERILADLQDAKAIYNERKREQAALDKMDDKLIEVLKLSRATIEARRKKTEKDIRDEKLRVLEAISNNMQSGEAERDAKDEAILNKAKKQKDAADDARREADRHKLESNRRERQEMREKYLRDEAQRLHEFNTTRQWELMNRFKNDEINKAFKEKLRKDKERKIQEHREDILRLWKERDDREAREKAESRYFYGELAEKKIRDNDNQVLTHAAHLLDECKRHDRPDFALRRTIDQYCKMHRLYPMPPLPSSMQEHFTGYAPWDGSKPDADYREPPPPDAPPRATEHSVLEMHADKPASPVGKRDGLQASPKGGPSKSATTDADKPTDDYKRTGRADGLQTRDLQTTVNLPKVTVIPCKSPSCHCELKPNTKG